MAVTGLPKHAKIWKRRVYGKNTMDDLEEFGFSFLALWFGSSSELRDMIPC